MKSLETTSPEAKDRILTWMMILTLRLYGQNVYSDDSYIWKVLELEEVEDIDRFFENVLGDFIGKHQDISRLLKIQAKTEDVLSRK